MIQLIFLLISIFCVNFSYAETVTEKLKLYLTQEELSTYVPIIDDPKIAVVDREGGDKNFVLGSHDRSETFGLKGYTFQQEAGFPVTTGDQFLITDEEIIPYPGNSFRVAITLTSPTTGQSKRFISNMISKNQVETVIEAVETERDFHIDFFACPYERNYVYHILNIGYELTIENGTKIFYNLLISADPGYESEKAVKYLTEFKEIFSIQTGDKIANIAPSRDYPYYYSTDLFREVDEELKQYTPKYDEVKKGLSEWCVLDVKSQMIGEKGALIRDKFEDQHYKYVIECINLYPRYYRIENFGREASHYPPQNKGIQTMPDFHKKNLRLVGYYIEELFNRKYRVFVFSDENNDFVLFGSFKNS